MELLKEHFRYALLLFFNQKKTATEGHRILIEVMMIEVAPSIKHVNIDSVEDLKLMTKVGCRFTSIIG